MIIDWKASFMKLHLEKQFRYTTINFSECSKII